MNENFRPVFEGVNDLKAKMRNCTTGEEWQKLKSDYKVLLLTAKQVFLQCSTEEKYKAFKERENSSISAIYQKVKKLWDSNDLEETEIESKPREYVSYDQSNYEADFAKEVEYWQTELFPKAMANNLQEWQITIEYKKHLREQYWNNMCCRPNIDLENEMRKHYNIYKREYNGETVPADTMID